MDSILCSSGEAPAALAELVALATGGDEADGGVFDDGSGSWAGSGDSARLSGSASGEGAGAAMLPPLKGHSVFTADVGDRGGEGGCKGGAMEIK